MCDLNNLRPDPKLKLRLNIFLIRDCTLSDYNLVHAPRLAYAGMSDLLTRAFLISQLSMYRDCSRREIFIHNDRALAYIIELKRLCNFQPESFSLKIDFGTSRGIRSGFSHGNRSAGKSRLKFHMIEKNISNYLITTIKRVTIFVVTLHFVFLIFANDALWSAAYNYKVQAHCELRWNCTVVYLMMMNIVITQKCSHQHMHAGMCRLHL